MSKAKTILSTLLASTMMTTAALASSDIMFILDGSGSMWGKVDGTEKITVAKNAMIDMLDKVPADSRIGLMTYGSKSKGSCEDVIQLNALGSDRDAIKTSIGGLKPLGKTPIDLALSKGIAGLSAQSSDVPTSLILVSDGIETCDGNPCKVAEKAKLAGVGMKVHVVGFNVDAEARNQLECIASAGGGQYFDAANTQGFEEAIDQVVQVAQAQPEPEPEPVVEEPAGPTITEFFRDDFDGEELAEHWAIENPNPDNFIVDGGVLTMISTTKAGFGVEKPENLITYTGELPKGDWDVVISFTGEMSSNSDRIIFGLRKDDKNFLTALYQKAFPGTGCQKTTSYLNKRSKGKDEFVEKIFRSNANYCYSTTAVGAEQWDTIQSAHLEANVNLTLSKRGRNYTTKTSMDGLKLPNGEPYVTETSQFTSLRSPGNLTFTIERAGDRFGNGNGEVLFNIDSVVINSVEE